MDVPSIIRLLSTGNNPPLFEIVLHYWIKIFGISPLSVRIPSLIFSSIAVGLLYIIGSGIFNRRIGIYASLIFIFSNFQIALTHEARVYELLGMLACLSMYLYLKILSLTESMEMNEPNSKNPLMQVICLSVINTLLIYSHYFGLFVILVQVLFLILNWGIFKKRWKLFLLGWAITLILYIPNIIVVLTRFTESAKGTWISKPSGIQDAYNMLRIFSNAPIVATIIIVIFAIRGIQFYQNKAKNKFATPGSFVGFWFVFIFSLMFVVSFWIPMFYARYLTVCNIGFVLFTAISIDKVFSKPKFSYIIPVVICSLFISTVQLSEKDKLPIKSIIEKIKANQTQETVVYFCPDWFDINFALYYNIQYFKQYNNKEIKKNMHAFLANKHVFPVKMGSDILREQWVLASRIIYLDANSAYHNTNNNVKSELDANHSLIKTYSYPGNFTIYIYLVRR